MAFMTERETMSEHNDFADNITKLLIMVERFENRFQAMDGRLARIENKADVLHHIVAGNGTDTSLVMRQRIFEDRLERVESKLDKMELHFESKFDGMEKSIDGIRDRVEAWRNRALGIAMFLSALTAAAAVYGERVISAVFGNP